MLKSRFMILDTSHEYVFRLGSDNQYRLHWNGKAWCYEFLAGSVIFDQQEFPNEDELQDALAMHGLKLERFQIDHQRAGEKYSAEIKKKVEQLERLGIAPCSKHGLTSKNVDGTCEACQNTDYPDDFKGTEG